MTEINLLVCKSTNITEENFIIGESLIEKNANACIVEFLEDGGDIENEWYSNNRQNQKTKFLYAWLGYESWAYEVNKIEIGIIVLSKCDL